MEYYTTRKIQKLYGGDFTPAAIRKAEAAGHIPKAVRDEKGVKKRRWAISDLPQIGKRYGFLKGELKKRPTVITVFTTKGGVLKSTISLNIARLAALHSYKVLVAGLDMQCDASNALGVGLEIDDDSTLQDATSQLDSTPGLINVHSGEYSLEQVIRDTDIPTLQVIPETPDLNVLEKQLSAKTMGELWIRDQIIKKLDNKYDLVILDCSPSWSELTSNALMACDLLISPLECKINHHRNCEAFIDFLDQFKSDTHHDFDTLFVPTKLAATQKLSTEIRQWYLKNINDCAAMAIRESVVGEDAMAHGVSFLEHDPLKVPSEEMRELIKEIWERVLRVGT